MKIRKQEIYLSPDHPSTLLDFEAAIDFAAPLVLNRTEFLSMATEDINSCKEILLRPCKSCENVFEAAYEMNLRSRTWDELDCFLWARWARRWEQILAGCLLNRFSTQF